MLFSTENPDPEWNSCEGKDHYRMVHHMQEDLDLKDELYPCFEEFSIRVSHAVSLLGLCLGRSTH